MYSNTIFNYLMAVSFLVCFFFLEQTDAQRYTHICISAVYFKVILTQFSTESILSRGLTDL